MHFDDIQNCLVFIREAERLKDVLRSAHTSSGRQESTAEHTWRLCLLGMVFESEFPDIDFARLLKISIIHDLGEAIGGDVPAIQQSQLADKSAIERTDLLTLMQSLPTHISAHFLELWEEYDSGSTREARLVKALDKIETIIQHNQGKNPASFNYAFNLHYGEKHMAEHPLFQTIRSIIDQDTAENARKTEAAPTDACC